MNHGLLRQTLYAIVILAKQLKNFMAAWHNIGFTLNQFERWQNLKNFAKQT